jgi:hypothetical protein
LPLIRRASIGFTTVKTVIKPSSSWLIYRMEIRADVARSYEFFRKIEFFQKAGSISTNEIQSLVDVLKRIGVLDRQMGTDALVMQGITP